MKLLFDFLPIVLFFTAFKLYGIYVATAVAVGASIAQVGFSWLRHRQVETMHLVTLALIVVLGGATLLLHDEMFIKWKPTAVNWAFAVAFLGSQFVGRKPLVERMLTGTLELPRPVWQRLNLSWVAFFLTMGAANIYVIYNFDTDTWVDFKLFGMLGLTILFLIVQAFYLARHIKPEEDVQGS
jgi:intracellular septation protein